MAEFFWNLSVAVCGRDDATVAPSLELADSKGRLGRIVYEADIRTPGWSVFAYPRDGEWRPHQRDQKANGDPIYGGRIGLPRNLGDGEVKRPVNGAAAAPSALLDLLKGEVPTAERDALLKVGGLLIPTLEKVAQAHARLVRR